jgi:hypothetical protein
LGFWLAILIHFSGINTVIDYAPAIFQSAGWKLDAALLATFVGRPHQFRLHRRLVLDHRPLRPPAAVHRRFDSAWR